MASVRSVTRPSVLSLTAPLSLPASCVQAGDTSLLIAVKNKDADCYEKLLAKDANVDAKDKVRGELGGVVGW